MVANQVAVIPPGIEKEAKTVNSDLDKGIEKNLDAALVASRLDTNLKYDVKNRVVVLKGEVDAQAKLAPRRFTKGCGRRFQTNGAGSERRVQVKESEGDIPN